MFKKEQKRVQILIDTDLYEKLRKYSFDTKLSHSLIVRRAMRQYLEEKQ